MLAGAALPVARNRATHLIAELGATPNRAAARLRDIPSVSTAATTRSRRSNEHGLPIRAGLLPASTLNQNTTDLGILRFRSISTRSSLACTLSRSTRHPPVPRTAEPVAPSWVGYSAS